MRLILLFLALVFWGFTGWAQPANDECSLAIALGAAPACTDQLYTNVGATASPGAIPTCFNGGNVQRDVWFTFQTTSTLTNVSIFVNGRPDGPNGRALTNPQVAIYRGNCGSLSQLTCATALPGAAQVRLDAQNLTRNTTYYLRINDFSATASANAGDFMVCVRDFVPAVNMGQMRGSTSCFGTLYDSGGPNGNYKDQENYTFTICPDQPHSCIEIEMVDYETEGVDNLFGDDRLNFYAGEGTGGPLLASVYGVSDGSPFVIQAQGGCVTVEFISDFFVNLPGFELRWQCSALPCDGSSERNPTPIASLPFDGTRLSTCTGKATFGSSSCATDRFLHGPDYVFSYESAGDICLEITVDGALPGTGIAVFDAPPGDPAANCVAVSAAGKIGSAHLKGAGTYYIVVAKDKGCTDFNVHVRQANCALSPALVDALRNPLNGCVNDDGLPSIFVFEDGFQDMDMRKDINSGCWLNVGDQADFYWFTIQAQTEGVLGFILASADVPSDIDFNVWGPFTAEQVVNSPDSVINFIANNQPIRSSWSPGPEPTGMVARNPITKRPVTDAYDCENDPGATGDDYISLITTHPGEVYVILVNDWGNEIQNGGIAVDWSPSTLGLLDPIKPEVIQGDTSICRGDSAQILVDIGNSSIQWISGAESLSCTDCPNPVAKPLQTTTYTAVVESVCYTDTIDVTVAVFRLDAGPDQTVCRGENLRIVGGGDYDNATYSWTVTPAAGVELSCTDCPNPTITANTQGTYTLRGTLASNDGGCTLTDQVQITVLNQAAPQYDITDRFVAICEGETVTIGVDQVSDPVVFSWTSVPPGTTSNQATFDVKPTVTTRYYVAIQGASCPVPSRDSVIVEVSKPPVIEVSNDTLLCFGDTIRLGSGPKERDVTYTWAGPETIFDREDPRSKATPLNSGRYTLTAVRGACQVEGSFEVNVNPADVEIANGDTAFLCLGNELSLMANVRNPAGVTLTPVWTSSDPAFDTLRTELITVAPTDSTVYYVEVRYEQCIQTDSILVVVDSLPADLTIMPADTSICEGAYVVFRTPAYETKDYQDITFQWLPNRGQQSPDSLLNMVVTPDTTTIYYRITTNGGCRDSTAATVEVKPIPELMVVPADTIACRGKTVPLQLIGPNGLENIMWTPPNGLSCMDCLNPKVTVTGDVQYSVQAEKDGCPGSATAVVRAFPDPILQLTSQTTICEGDSVRLNNAFSPAASYVWTSTDPNFGTVTEPRPTVAPTSNTTYFVTARYPNSNCDPVTAQVTIQVVGTVTLTASAAPGRICSGESALLTATAAGGTPSDSYVWRTNSGLQFEGAQVRVFPERTTTYFLTYRSAGDCQVLNQSVTVTVDPGVKVTITTDAPNEVPEGTEVVLTAEITTESPDQPTIAWTENGAVISGASGPSVTVRPVTDGTEYVVTVTTPAGCTASDSITFNVTEPQFAIPNAFTPNGDGQNDRFRILISGDIEQIVRFQVYNRWGQVVYDNDNATEGWDGNFNGKPQPSDVYVYVITARTFGGREEVRKGEIALIR